MKKRNMTRIFFFSIALLFICSRADAQYPAVQVKTVIRANYAGSAAVTPRDSARVEFDFSSLPGNSVKIDSCKLQLVVQSKANNKAVVTILYAGSKALPPSLRTRQINIVSMENDIRNDSIITINVNPDFITNSLGGTMPVSLKTTTPNDNIRIQFYPTDSTAPQPNYAPRLLVYYTMPVTTMGADWRQPYAGERHAPQIGMRYYGAAPASFQTVTLNDLGSIQKDLIAYNGLIYAVANNPTATSTRLYAIDPITRFQQLVADNLPVAKEMPVIDPFGRLYYISENSISVIELLNNYKRTDNVIRISNGKTLKSFPTVGSDGSLYLSLNDIIYAYSPFPKNKLIWQYSLGGSTGNKSAVSLNKPASIAYVVSYDTRTIIGINANSGLKMYEAPVELIADQTQGAVVPSVDDDGDVYVCNKIVGADKMFVYNETLSNARTIKANKSISLPVATTDNTVYFVLDEQLMKYAGGGDPMPVAKFDGITRVRSITSDRSNNVYCLGQDNNLFYAYNNDARTTIKATVTVNPQRALIMNTDGSLYTATSSQLVSIRPAFTDNATLTKDMSNYNIATFRGNTTTVEAGSTLNKNQAIVGSSGVVFSNNITIGGTARMIVEAKRSISFGKGFTVKQGAVVSCKTGY